MEQQDGVKYIRDEKELYKLRSEQYSVAYGVIGFTTAVLAALSPSIGKINFVSASRRDVLTFGSGLLAAGLAFLQTTEHYDQRAERYGKGQLILERALAKYDLGQADKAYLANAYDAAEAELSGGTQPSPSSKKTDSGG